MGDPMLAQLFEHNNWANLRLIDACADLGDDPLDALPSTGGDWSIRRILIHLVSAQRGYLLLLTVPVEQRRRDPPAFERLSDSARESGAALLALVRDDPGVDPAASRRTTDGYVVPAATGQPIGARVRRQLIPGFRNPPRTTGRATRLQGKENA